MDIKFKNAKFTQKLKCYRPTALSLWNIQVKTRNFPHHRGEANNCTIKTQTVMDIKFKNT